MKETLIQRTILDALTWRKILCWRQQSIPVPIRRGRAIVGLRRADPHTIGMPDICAIIKGRFYGIEIKSETGKQSLDQKRWEKLIVDNDGVYILARSWDDVEKVIL